MKSLRERLAEEGCDVNKRGMWESTPLIVACQYRHSDVALALCDTPGVDIAAVNEKGATALLYAAMEGLQDVVERLLAMGLDTDTFVANASPAVVYNSSTDCNLPLTPPSPPIRHPSPTSKGIAAPRRRRESALSSNGCRAARATWCLCTSSARVDCLFARKGAG